MNTKTSSTFTVDLKIAEKLLIDLKGQGFEITKPQYTRFSAKRTGLSCTLYESGKLLVQGKNSKEFIEFYLEPEVLGTFSHSNALTDSPGEPHIGIDEAGKGDFFGPLCIAGVYADGNGILKLKEMGVKDSKNMSDKAVIILAKKIEQSFDHQIVRINPLKYNELYSKFGNLNHLLAWGHATAIEALYQKTGCDAVLIDQFAAEHVVETALKRKSLSLNLTQRHRGEEDVVVAAASILARKTFLEGLDILEKQFSQPLPKGASKAVISAGKNFVRNLGQDMLKNVAKLHFKTFNAVLENE